jgi:hypothetical protein
MKLLLIIYCNPVHLEDQKSVYVAYVQRCLTSASGYVQHRKGPQDYYDAPHVTNRVTGVGKRAAMDEN